MIINILRTSVVAVVVFAAAPSCKLLIFVFGDAIRLERAFLHLLLFKFDFSLLSALLVFLVFFVETGVGVCCLG
jgi:hypothetical protein